MDDSRIKKSHLRFVAADFITKIQKTLICLVGENKKEYIFTFVVSLLVGIVIHCATICE